MKILAQRIFKTVLSGILALSLILCINVSAEVVSGSCGKGVNWAYNTQTQSLTFSGYGAIIGYNQLTDIPWKAYCGDVKTVTVEKGINKIGKNALTWFEIAEEIKLADSVTELEEHALGWNESLKSITLPKNLVKIGTEAFVGCFSLKKIDIPAKTTYIDSTAFLQCLELESINVDASNTAYSSTDGVLYSTADNSLTAYPIGKTNTSFTLPDNIVKISDSAFRQAMNLTEVNLGNLETIDKRAFSGCENLAAVHLNSVKTIGELAFYGCTSLNSFMFPADTSAIGDRAFRSCASLELAQFACNGPAIGSDVFKGAQNLAISGLEGSSIQRYAAENALPFYPLVNVNYKGSAAKFDPAAFIINDSTMVPMRAVFEMLGAKVSWDDATSTATAEKDGIKISVQIGKKTMYRGAESTDMPESVRLIAQRTYVPLRAVSEAFGSKVDWQNETYTVNIY